MTQGAITPESLRQHGVDLGNLVAEKFEAYGSAFYKVGDFLRMLYPDGIKPEQYSDAVLLARIFDKQMRVAHRKDAFGESPFLDIAGHALLGIANEVAAKGEDAIVVAGDELKAKDWDEAPAPLAKKARRYEPITQEYEAGRD